MWWIDIGTFSSIHQLHKENLEEKMTIVRVAGIPGSQLIQNAARVFNKESGFLTLVLKDCNPLTLLAAS
jgi:hypothetical protein